jgi:hypothetical protein
MQRELYGVIETRNRVVSRHVLDDHFALVGTVAVY